MRLQLSLRPVPLYDGFELELGECRHNEEIAVKIGHSFFQQGNLCIAGSVIVLKQMSSYIAWWKLDATSATTRQ